MKKQSKLLSLTLAVILTLGLVVPAAAAEASAANPSTTKLAVDGKSVPCTAYIIKGNNYFKLRDLGKALGFNVGWSKEQGVYIETDQPYAE